MTVKELIAKLCSLPADADVYIQSPTGGWYQPSNAEVKEDSEDVVEIR